VTMMRRAPLCMGMLATTMVMACASAARDEMAEGTASELQVCASTTLKGVDVSHHNDRVDWAKVKSSGRVFAFARVSDGTAHPDTEFARNWPGMKSAGLVRGAYQFFRPQHSGTQQADLLIQKIKDAGGLKAGDFPPVLDLETSDDVAAKTVVARAKAWLARVEAKTGTKPIIYTGNNMSDTIGDAFKDYVLWVLHYGVACPRVPAGWSTWAFWQNAEKGSVPGISGDTDTDFFNGTRDNLDELRIGNAPAEKAIAPTAEELDDSGEEPGVTPSDSQPDAVMGWRL